MVKRKEGEQGGEGGGREWERERVFFQKSIQKNKSTMQPVREKLKEACLGVVGIY